MTTENFEEIPIGMFVTKAFHESGQKFYLHLSVRVDGREWCYQPSVPAYSSGIGQHEEFWEWAQKNLPVYHYPKKIKGVVA